MSTSETHSMPTQPAGSPDRAVLLRSRNDRMIGGVCGGLGRFFGIEPVLVRILFVLLAVAGGSGVVAYVLAWVLIPEERPGDPASSASRPEGVGTSAVLVGALLVVAGTVLLLDQVIPGFRRVLGPLVLIVVGLSVLLVASRR